MEDTSSNAINPNNNIVRNWLAGIAIVLVVLIAFTYLIHRNDTMSSVVGDTSSSTTAAETPTTTVASTAGGGTSSTQTGNTISSGSFTALPGTLMTASKGEAISVVDQSSGTSVAIGSMKLTGESWVAVEAMNGSILGAGLFPATATSGVIPLLRNTVAAGIYEVVIYADKTAKTFDFHQDPLVTGADGSPVAATFMGQ